MKHLKVSLIALAMKTGCSGAFVQFGVGTGLAYIMDFGDLAISARVSYDVTEEWRDNGTFSFHFGDTNVDIWQLGFDANYTFWGNKTLDTHAVGGINFTTVSIDRSAFGGSTSKQISASISASISAPAPDSRSNRISLQ